MTQPTERPANPAGSDAVPEALHTATAITADRDGHEVIGLSTGFALERPLAEVTSATLWATAHGVYEATINGRAVSDSVLDPAWTSYEWRLQVQEFDVAGLLDQDNVVDIRLGGGWWFGDFGFLNANANYGTDLGFLAALVVRYADGTETVVTTGPDWTGHTTDSPFASIYDGQIIDARLRGLDPQPRPLREVEIDRATLIPQTGPQVRRQEVLAPVAVTTSPSGKTLIDFGQNLVGWLRVRVSGPAGTEVVLRHAEVLEHGELGTRPLREAKATDTLILSGGEDVFEPTFTFHGFRYAEVTGWPGKLTADTVAGAIEAVVVHSEMARTGWFACSDPLVNQLVSNSVWGQKGNFLAVPTDCPQRDERLGWTGDLAVYVAGAAYQFDVSDFLHNWLLDLRVETEATEHGWVPHIAPDVLKHGHIPDPFGSFLESVAGPTAIWGDASVWVPQALWEAYGDLERLAEHYPTMVLHLAGIEPRVSADGLWDTGFQFGDWLDPDAPPDQPGAAKADPSVIATACLYRSASFAAEAAGLLGKAADEARWRDLAGRLRAGFATHYVAADGTIRSDCAAVYALAIVFGLLDEEAKARAGARLAEVVEAAGYRVTTGFAGTPYVTWALSETGHTDRAYRLLLERTCPSWLYPVTIGATTIWERWDSMLEDGTINPGEMTSFNHYALGAVADWLYKIVAGIQPAQPGYTHIRLTPTPGPGLDWATGRLTTRHGRIECGWTRNDDDTIAVTATIPPGTTADLHHPDGTTHTLTPGTHTI